MFNESYIIFLYGYNQRKKFHDPPRLRRIPPIKGGCPKDRGVIFKQLADKTTNNRVKLATAFLNDTHRLAVLNKLNRKMRRKRGTGKEKPGEKEKKGMAGKGEFTEGIFHLFIVLSEWIF